LSPRRRRASLLAEARTDPDAFGAFYAAYVDNVLAFFMRRVFDVEVALDLTAETFAMALDHREQFRGSSREEEQGWLFAIARSQLRRFWRRGAVERAALERLGIDVPAVSYVDIERIEQLAGIRALKPAIVEALQTLPRDQQRAVELRVLEELDYGEVAGILDVTEQVARARVSRGLRTLRRALQPLSALVDDAR